MTGTEASPEIAASHAACEEITRREAANFYHGLKLTPMPQRQGLFALYAWMRRADDIVDDGEGGAAARADALERFAEETRAAFAGERPSGDPMWPAFIDSVRRWSLPPEPFDDMLLGQRQDLTLATLPDWPALREFCRRVASTVGVLCVRVWGLDEPRDLELAEARGIAFQLTNILRDLREDHARGRVYLPQDELRAAGLDLPSILDWRDPARCRAFVAEQAARARAHYRESAPLDERLEPACRPTLWAMTRIYSGILERIEADPSRVAGTRRVGLSTLRKVCIAIEAKRLGRRWARSTATAR
jgi:phytoene synthase